MANKENSWKWKVNTVVDEILSKYAFCTYEDTGTIMVYSQDEGIYMNAESTIIRECCLNEDTNTPAAKNMIELNIRGKTYRNRHIYKDAVCLNNGILQIDNGFKIIPHTPKLVFESKVPIDFVKDSDCPIWKETVLRMLPEEKDRMLLQEWFGYHFMPGQPYEKAMFMTGKQSTGKSTTISVLNQLLGGCCAHHQLSEFQKDNNYSTADLYGKLGNTYTDMGNSMISDVGIFKVLTGSMDLITARFPYERPFNFLNSAKLTFASNRLPPLSAAVQGDPAFWKRVLLLQYSNQVKVVDTQIYDKLRSELSGILNWSLEGYLRLVNNKGKFTQNTEDVYSSWTHSAYSVNPLDDFIDECCLLERDVYIVCNELRQMYNSWCIKYNELPISPTEFRSNLASKGVFEGTKMNKSEGKREQIYKGICVN